jgi:hypothetical protein
VFFPLKRKKVYLDFYKVAFIVLNSIKRKKHFSFIPCGALVLRAIRSGDFPVATRG